MTQSASLAAIRYERGFDIGALLRRVVEDLRSEGMTIGGVLQVEERSWDACCPRLFIVDLRSGRRESISQYRGKESRGCKFDAGGLAAISHCLSEAIANSVDLLIVNKFGAAESEGEGLLSCIGDAVLAGVPVLTTVREPYVDAWRSFHAGLAADLPANLSAVLEWWSTVHDGSEAPAFTQPLRARNSLHPS